MGQRLILTTLPMTPIAKWHLYLWSITFIKGWWISYHSNATFIPGNVLERTNRVSLYVHLVYGVHTALSLSDTSAWPHRTHNLQFLPCHSQTDCKNTITENITKPNKCALCLFVVGKCAIFYVSSTCFCFLSR